MKIDNLVMMAAVEQAGLPALRIAFTVAVLLFLSAGVFIWRRRHSLFGRDPNVEDDLLAVRHNREELIVTVWAGLTLLLISVLFQVWSP